MRAAILGLLILGFVAPAARAGPRLTKGQVTEKIACLRDPSQTYSVYVPPSYDANRRHPALLIFDPRGRGTLAAEIFRPAAERFGWIVISSNDTPSDGPMGVNAKALAALWPEVNERYASDAKRIYAAGFSGGGVLALSLGLQTGALAGVINCGGRLPEGLPLEKARFAHYGAAGRFDFNHLEMSEIDLRYERVGPPHRLDVFEGGHEWLPKELATRALNWLEVGAEAEAARRALEAMFVQTSSNVTREFFGKDEPAKAALVLQVAAELKPETPHVHYNLACAFARLGDRKSALASLEEAVARGFTNLAQIREDPDLAPLRAEARYRALVDRLRSPEPSPPPTPSTPPP